MCGINSIRNTRDNEKILIVGVFASWLAFLAQSIISIDNIGLTTWGWVLGGALIGFSIDRNQHTENFKKLSPANKKLHFVQLKQKIVSSVLLLVAFVFCSSLYLGEKYMFQVNSFSNPQASDQSPQFYISLKNLDDAKLVEPAYRFRVANILFQVGQIDESEKRVYKLLKSNPDNYDYLFGAAQIKSYKKDWNSVVNLREKLQVVDPWNAENDYMLAKAFEFTGNYEKAAENYQKILTYAKDEKVGLEAAKALELILQQ